MHIAVFQADTGSLSPQERIQRLDHALAEAQADLFVCPELFSSGYNVGELLKERAESKDGQTSRQISILARKHGCAIVYGYPERADNRYYNAALCVDKNAKVLANHRKLLIPPGGEIEHFEPGDSMTFFSINGFKFCILICYDAEFPETVRAAAIAGAHVVIVPTALAANWGVVSDKVMPGRAFENGVWLVYANHAGTENNLTYFGGSCIVQPNGCDAARAGTDEQIISSPINMDDVKKAQERLPYIKQIHRLERILG